MSSPVLCCDVTSVRRGFLFSFLFRLFSLGCLSRGLVFSPSSFVIHIK